MLVEHLKYEFDVLDAAYDFIHGNGHDLEREDWLRINSAIEAFWLHARNLIEFFERRTTGDDKGIASAEDFTKRPVQYDLPPKRQGIRLMIDQQVCHLQYNRITDADHKSGHAPTKIGGTEMWQVKGMIDRALTLFQKELTYEGSELWETRSPPKILAFGGGVSASSHSTAATSTVIVGKDLGPQGATGPRR
jgi:hypothetical protein